MMMDRCVHAAVHNGPSSLARAHIRPARHGVDAPVKSYPVEIWRLEVNGGTATADQLAYPAIVNFGHFTAMQVRDGGVRGLDLHLSRLDSASREMFGTGLDGDRVRAYIRHALAADTPAASVRVSVFQPDANEDPTVMVIVRPPAEPPTAPQRLTVVRYERPVAHIKHVGTFGQIWHGQAAERAGFDDALLVGPDGIIAESSIGNIGFYDGTAVSWPDAPMLTGVTMQLVTSALAARGTPSRHSVVHIGDLASFQAAFVANSLGVVPVGQIDGVPLHGDPEYSRTLAEAYDSVPWDRI